MYCRNCGNEVNDNAVACPKCGYNPRTEKNFCPNCGVATNANQVMCTNCGTSLATAGVPAVTADNSKTVAIVAHFTLIGWIIALILNNQNKTQLGSFYVRQTLGIMIIGIVGSFTVWLFFIGVLLWIFAFVLWLISLINAINGKMNPIPVVGEMFQNWFKGI